MLFCLVEISEYCRHRIQILTIPHHCVLFLLLLAEVALIIEVTEEDDEGDAVAEHHHVHGVGEVAVCEQVVAGVQEEQHELHLLEGKSSDQISSQTYRQSSHIPLI